MTFSHFNVFTENKFIGSIYQEVIQLIACYDNGKEAPFNSDYMVIKTFSNLDEAVEALKAINNSIGEWRVQ